MKARWVVKWSAVWVAALFLVVLTAPAQNKQIRLRNELIATEPPGKQTAVRRGQPDDRAVTGLFLIQLEDRLQPAWRTELQSLRVELLRYVPDDAFVALLENVRVQEVRRLPFVRWVGEYRPEHKIHQALNDPTGARPAGEDVAISVLFSPAARPADAAEARRSFRRLNQEANHRFGAVLRGTIPRGRLKALADSAAVLWIEPEPKIRLYDEASAIIIGGDAGLHQTVHQSLGYSGQGVTVAVTDSGLHNGDAPSMHPDLFGRVSAFQHYGNLSDAADEHSHGTHVAGIIAGNGATGEVDEYSALYGLGVAPMAQLVAQRIFDSVGNYEAPPTFETLTRDAKQAGADIGSNSWGDDTQGRYDLSAMEFDALVRDADAQTPDDQPYILEFSAGNAGPGSQTIGSPAVAKNVIATGAAQSDRLDYLIYADGPNAMADFSSRGPCEDGRIKPDVVAPGTWIASLKSASATDENAWAPISDNYLYMGGTSQAGPHVSGAAAVFVQYYRDWYGGTPSPALVKAALINSAVDMPIDPENLVQTPPVPNMEEGWGRIDLTQLIEPARGYELVDQTELLSTGQTAEYRVLVGSSDEPLKVTLAYTDVPGLPSATAALVNDLDLEVEGPDGKIYRGNQFDGGESVPDDAVRDSINNVEGVHLLAPLPGEFVIRVRAHNVVEDSRIDTPEIDQDFALVISGSFALPGTGIVTLDRPAYRVPGVIQLKLVDANLSGQPTVSLLLRSSTESSGESVLLRASGSTGSFTGSVATATGPAQVNGRLEINHGDLIEAIYQDANPPATRVFTARADLQAPQITQVSVTNRFGRALIRWHTDEPASSLLSYGTNALLGLSVTNRSFKVNHEVGLDNLVPGRRYYFKVACADVAGNTATNDNGSALFNFVAPFAPAVLVVDAFDSDLLLDPIPPLENYTRPLDQLGTEYDVWVVNTTNSPAAADLRPYRVVIWRLPEFNLYRPTFTAPERSAITEYLGSGGSLFVASMEVLTRLDEVGASAFRRDILHVDSFDTDVTVPGVSGVDNDPIGDGLSLGLDYLTDYSLAGLFELDYSDTIRPGTNATGILVSDFNGRYAGLRYPRAGVDAPGRVVFLSFPFDTVVEGDPAPDNRAELLRRILVFLAPGMNGAGNVTLDRSVYTIPSQVTVEVADSDLEGLGQTTVTFFSDTQTSGQTVTLTETLRQGVFRGTITLVGIPTGSGDPELRVRSGDRIRAEYHDASRNVTVTASATIETTPPIISNIWVEPGYVDATVRWDTSEPADSFVQFGDSTAFGRVATQGDFVYAHEVTLYELEPGRTYYYRVISHDRAGNMTLAGTNTFTTLQPLYPPWSDNLESGDANWTVYTTEESEKGWALGPPNSDFAAAHSPVNAWGCNLSFDWVSQMESYLISPAIFLTNGNKAILRFWHSYDFTMPFEFDILHGGEVLLITNSAVAPVTLHEWTDDTADWGYVDFDLTPYVGQLVYVVWHYVLFSFDSWPRQGWLVDDIEVTITNLVTGTVEITNNLAQASFMVAGPTSRSGQGKWLVITNALPGDYSVTFNDVPFYIKPPPQTKAVAPRTVEQFVGHYTFADANTNGMSDAWEQSYFREVSPTRNRTTDSDNDGFTDYAEFIAGTNPTLPTSKLQLKNPIPLEDDSVRFQWPSAKGRAYRVEASSNALTWTPVTDWLRAPGSAMDLTLPSSVIGSAYLFRLEVKP